jgi:hypothetical protein
MSNSGKSAYFRHIFAKNNFFVHFLNTFFNGFEISVKFCVFDTFFDFFKKKFRRVIFVLFSNFEAKRAKNGSKKRKTFLFKLVLEFSYATIKGLE